MTQTRSSRKNQAQELRHEEYPDQRNFKETNKVTKKRTIKSQDINPIKLINQIKTLDLRIKSLIKNEGNLNDKIEELKDVIKSLSKQISHAKKHFGEAWNIIMDLYQEDPENNETIEVEIQENELDNNVEVEIIQEDEEIDYQNNEIEEINESIEIELIQDENIVLTQNESQVQFEDENTNSDIYYSTDLNELANVNFNNTQYFFDEDVYDKSYIENIPESPNYNEFLNDNFSNDLDDNLNDSM